MVTLPSSTPPSWWGEHPDDAVLAQRSFRRVAAGSRRHKIAI
jgi:hypothetical protein